MLLLQTTTGGSVVLVVEDHAVRSELVMVLTDATCLKWWLFHLCWNAEPLCFLIVTYLSSNVLSCFCNLHCLQIEHTNFSALCKFLWTNFRTKVVTLLCLGIQMRGGSYIVLFCMKRDCCSYCTSNQLQFVLCDLNFVSHSTVVCNNHPVY